MRDGARHRERTAAAMPRIVRRSAGPFPRALRATALGGLVALACAPARPAGAQEQRFRHEVHASFECAECHQTGGATSSANDEWCADCHHVNVAPGECVRCHPTGAITPAPARPLVTFRFSVGEPRTRPVPFDHGTHGRFECAECHAGGPGLGVRRSCSSCHAEHHEPERDCTACHPQPTFDVHPSDHVHLRGCDGAGCHAVEGFDYEALKESRSLCLSCHQTLRDHEAPEPCVRCHLLGQPGGAERGARP